MNAHVLRCGEMRNLSRKIQEPLRPFSSGGKPTVGELLVAVIPEMTPDCHVQQRLTTALTRGLAHTTSRQSGVPMFLHETVFIAPEADRLGIPKLWSRLQNK